MTDPISGVSAKALSAVKPEQKKDEELRSSDVEPQDARAARQMSDEVQLSDETVVELKRAGFDEAKVAQIKQALADGNYPLDPKRIAEGFTEIEKLL
ncbi:MAG: flagellar biosynthesis anti-sigma factor FlgM [Gammaproteobacteria bacterium]|jgi:flagellar biosynthesis anti-sigma factor FlgM